MGTGLTMRRRRTLVQTRKLEKEATINLAMVTDLVASNCPAVLAPPDASRSRRSGPLQLATQAL